VIIIYHQKIFFENEDIDVQYQVLNKAFSNVTHFLFGYPDGLDIKCIMCERESLINRYLESDIRYAPKSSPYQIRISIKELLDEKNTNDLTWNIISPVVTNSDIKYLTIDNLNKSEILFGSDAKRIRGSILNSILKFGEFNKVDGKDVFVFDYDAYRKERGN
jgi:hypothetical protein